MADFKVSQNSGASAHSVKLSSGNSFTISQEKTVVADLLSDLADVDHGPDESPGSLPHSWSLP